VTTLTPEVPALHRRSLAPAVALIAIGVAAWVFLLILTAVHAAFVANYGDPGSGAAVLAVLIVVLTVISFIIEVLAGVLALILGWFALRRKPVRAPVRTVLGLVLIGTSIAGSFLVFAASSLPAGYVR
jgi:hypothetical protein